MNAKWRLLILLGVGKEGEKEGAKVHNEWVLNWYSVL